MIDVVGRSAWGARPPNHAPSRIAMPARPGVELHHSFGLYGASNGREWMRSMQADHLSRPNYADIWYSLAIWTDGVIYEGRGTAYRSAPTDLLTVCLAGNYNTRPFTAAQQTSVQAIRRWAREQGAGIGVGWHAQRMAVACPGTNVINWARNPPPLQEDDDMEPVPKPSWVSDELLDRLLAARVLLARPDREPLVVWRMYVFLDRTMRASGGGGGDFAPRNHTHNASITLN